MRRRPLFVAAVAGAVAVLAFAGSSAAADPVTYTFTGSYTGAECGTNEFAVADGMRTIEVVATADLPANDIVLYLYAPSGAVLVEEDNATSPEPIHYSTGQPLTPGDYSIGVCSFEGADPLPPNTYTAAVTVTDVPAPGDPAPGQPPTVTFAKGVSFAPSTTVSPTWFGSEPQVTIERKIKGSQPGAVDPNRVFVDWPNDTYTQSSLFNRSDDGGDSFRLLLGDECGMRSKPACGTTGGGDSETDVNLITGTLLISDQGPVVAAENLASSTDHGDSWPLTRQYPISNTTTIADRQWIAWVDPAAVNVLGRPIEAFLTWHLPAAGQYIIGVDSTGTPIPQPVPQFPNVGQSGQLRVDNSKSSPGYGWIYQPYRGYVQNPGTYVAAAYGPEFQDPTAWVSTRVTQDSAAIFPWLGVDDGGNAYLVWVDAGTLYLSMSPIQHVKNNPAKGGRPGTFWTTQVRVNPPSITSTVFPQVVGGADGRLAISYTGSTDCVGQSDVCANTTTWRAYAAIIPDALNLATSKAATVYTGEVSHRIVKRGAICTSGTTCTGDRSFLDMMDVSYDQSGRAGVVFMDGNSHLQSPNLTGSSKEYPYTLFAKQLTGPSLKGGTLSLTTVDNTRDDRTGDATWPNRASAENLPSLDLTKAQLVTSGANLVAVISLKDATTAGMGRDLAAYNARQPATDAAAASVQYVLRFHTAEDVVHLSAEYRGGALTYFAGKLDQGNDALVGPTGVVYGARHEQDVPAAGYLSKGSLVITVPLAALGLADGQRVTGATAFALAEPADNSDYLTPDRTVDASPPFDALLSKKGSKGLKVPSPPK